MLLPLLVLLYMILIFWYSYSKKFNSDVKASTSTSRKMPQFSNKQITTIMKICAHCKEKKEASQSTAYNTTFYCTSCLTEKLAW